MIALLDRLRQLLVRLLLPARCVLQGNMLPPATYSAPIARLESSRFKIRQYVLLARLEGILLQALQQHVFLAQQENTQAIHQQLFARPVRITPSR